jgi:hypothetical protein
MAKADQEMGRSEHLFTFSDYSHTFFLCVVVFLAFLRLSHFLYTMAG